MLQNEETILRMLRWIMEMLMSKDIPKSRSSKHSVPALSGGYYIWERVNEAIGDHVDQQRAETLQKEFYADEERYQRIIDSWIKDTLEEADKNKNVREIRSFLEVDSGIGLNVAEQLDRASRQGRAYIYHRDLIDATYYHKSLRLELCVRNPYFIPEGRQIRDRSKEFSQIDVD